ncbi:hypothetical protein D9757_001793 [Collybiopsis confluens]|uniref:Fe2OG dioxygenase domain-containing protein n=1 Tax=Collybiopsis confluens TaxID=2823264 RepID=A0A8H5HYN6_9AGAR|nr:hypothetical protein D9757_001793 [Collybiopsis confluens]
MTDEGDTETLLAIVASLVDEKPSSEAILNALVESDGDPERAAQLLNHSHPNPDNGGGKGKRKRTSNLDSWIRNPNHTENTPKDASSSKIQRTSSPSKKTTPVSDLMTVLKQPTQQKSSKPRKPLTLSTPDMISKHTPCTIHSSVLPPDLASRLFYSMEESSRNWQRNKWWLFDRLVESPHRTSFFVRKTDGVDDDETWHQSAQYWYNGRVTDTQDTFTPEMEEACQIIERLVTQEIRKRSFRYPLEWSGGDTGSQTDLLWRANVAASNRYEGRTESVGWHSDTQTYLGPYCTIASLSLGTRRVFSLREVIPSSEAEARRSQTFNIPLSHNSLIIMHASCQERFKHSIPPQAAMDVYRPTHPRFSGGPIEPSNCRINITFRFYRPDFRPNSIPQCKCGIPMILRADMKNRIDGQQDKYWWTCHAGAQNDGKTCNMWKVMEMEIEGRGPTIESARRKEATSSGASSGALEKEDGDGTK